MIEPIAISLEAANAYVAADHRHSVPARGHKFSVGAIQDGQLVGVAIVGGPTARLLDDGLTLEILRVLLDGPAQCVLVPVCDLLAVPA